MAVLPSHPFATAAARDRLRVCMMVTYDMASPGGGVKHHAQQLAAALRRRGDEVMIVGPSSVALPDPEQALEPLEAEFNAPSQPVEGKDIAR